MMFTIFGILAIIVSLLMVLAVVIQNSKGGGLSPSFGGAATQILGARRSSEYIEQVTWVLGAALVVFSIVANISLGDGETAASLRMGSAIEDQIVSDPAALPDASTLQQPAQQDPNAGQ
ncbi:MAG: preprotein translocase subunit SecG [Bacteroidia bacterium]|nr:preprotein translocase subunit SecG [Bacteroidia bacterium]